MSQIHHRYETVGNHRVFHREAGSPEQPHVVLLHGYPASSFMFRNLIPRLTGYHVIAPDLLGFGLSDSPSPAEFPYTFDALTDVVQNLLLQLGVQRYVIFVHDYGAPVGWRLMLRNPEAVVGVITQNGNGYAEGFVPEFWNTIWEYNRTKSPEIAAGWATDDHMPGVKWQYLTGVADASLVDPDAYLHDAAGLSRDGNPEIQLAILGDYASNLPLYEPLHDQLRARSLPVLAVWGRGDEIFRAAGAQAFARDTPYAEVHLLDGGHFLLESAIDEVSELVVDFLGRVTRR